MYKSIKVWAKTFTRKETGVKFVKATIQGKFLPKSAIDHTTPIEDDVFYSVRGADIPVGEDGQYQIYFSRGWIDSRDGFDHVIRVKGDPDKHEGVIVEFLQKHKEKASASLPDED